MNGKLGVLALLLVGVVAVSAFAMPFGRGSDAVRDAIEAGDYAAWQEAVEAQHQQMMAGMTEDKFTEMQAHHAEMAEKRAERDASREALHDAIEAGDYDAWKNAVGDRPIADVVTEDNWSTFVAMHEAEMSGDHETARQLADELGIEEMGPRGRGRMDSMPEGRALEDRMPGGHGFMAN